MKSRALRIVVGMVGLVLLALGGFYTATDILSSFHSDGSSSSAQSFTLMIRTHWVVAAFGGALLCVLSFFIGRRRA